MAPPGRGGGGDRRAETPPEVAHFHQREELSQRPHHAWGSQVPRGRPRVEIRCGVGIETREVTRPSHTRPPEPMTRLPVGLNGKATGAHVGGAGQVQDDPGELQ